MVAGDETRSAGAHPILRNRGRGGALERRVMGKVQIVVAGERQEAAAVAFNPWAFPAKTLGKRAPQRGALKLRQFGAGEIVQRSVRHIVSRWRGTRGYGPGRSDRRPHSLSYSLQRLCCDANQHQLPALRPPSLPAARGAPGVAPAIRRRDDVRHLTVYFQGCMRAKVKL